MQATAWNTRYAQLANSVECQNLRGRQHPRRFGEARPPSTACTHTPE
eukprot:CAMPEP_0177241638 /NCGR_PEP_ID=MMETSP0367-20130122/48380_1 /TAXON_ID=447022 ORGANISM="Scrippsiella hangoei-like, Strain SHHI-4" /NCGR_SAMPLE_ID=MMETSP0367 /ASSEMBLY_ACC=CAM_ASM_000362 /LENGTH=46 /DNA_ID= /DNA_START= /DNA_END= /DNA_ORIENTATION=